MQHQNTFCCYFFVQFLGCTPPYQRFDGKNHLPQELHWNGRNEQGEWVKAGAAISAVYEFTDPKGVVYSGVDAPMRFKGIVHKTEDRIFLSLDSSTLFGQEKQSKEILKPDGENLLLSACDWMKRWYPALSVRVRASSGDLSLANAQAERIKEFLSSELKILPQRITSETTTVPFPNQIVELILLKR